MVNILFKSTLREIRQSLGRFLAISTIITLGVGFLSGLRMAQPTMSATGTKYLDDHSFHAFRLLSTLGFTQDDVDAFGALDGIDTATGTWYTEFLWQSAPDTEQVLVAHSLTDNVNLPHLTAGRMPENGQECLGDSFRFSPEDIGKTIHVSPNNDEDTLDLLRYEEYTLVGLASSPLYLLNYERGTASIGNGTVSAFIFLPPEGFDSDTYYEIYLTMADAAPAYSEEYDSRSDELKPQVEALLEERAELRYNTLYTDAMEEIHNGEQELADGWEEYRTERADAEQELADALNKLTDGEQEYADGVADYEQGKRDYAEGLSELEQGKKDYAEGLAELEQGKKDYAEGLAEFEDGKAKYEDGLKEYQDGLAEYQDGLKQYEDGLKEYHDGEDELDAAARKLSQAEAQLDAALEQLERGEAAYEQLAELYAAGEMIADSVGLGSPKQIIAILNAGILPELNKAVDQALRGEGSSLDEFLDGWAEAEESIGTDLTKDYLDDLNESLTQGRAEYEEGYDAYLSGRSEYNSGVRKLAKAKQELADAKRQLADAKQQLDDAAVELADAEQEILDGEKELADAWQEILDGEQKLADAWQEILDGEKELADARIELDKAPGKLADARRELDDGWQEYYDGLAEAETEFTKAENELHDGETEISDAYVKLADLKHATTYTLTRSENMGYASFDNDTAIVAAISVVFPLFFFLVAALVCITTMKRMVEEQRTQIGVLKAIGYSRRQIIGKYLFYSGSAATIGSVIGYGVGSRGLPVILWDIYAIMYGFAPLEKVFDPLLAVICVAAALLCSMGTTYLSCHAELEKHAAQLLRPKTPKSGKRILLERIPFIWNRLSFLRKVSIRNVMRYRSRLLMMVLGIGGCTALIVTAFGVQNSIGSIVNEQFGRITLYDYGVNFIDPIDEEYAAAFMAELGYESGDALLVHSGSTDVVTDNGTKSVYLILPTDDSLDGFINLHSGETPIPFPGVGEVVLNNGLARALDISVGDKVQLRDEKLGVVEATVSGICDNFTFNYVYASPETYRQQLDTVPAFKTLLIHGHEGADPYEESVVFSSHEDVSNVSINEDTRVRVNTLLERLDLIVIVLVLFAGALAFVVLYNLININITERIREIATIKVLGFYRNETAAYVFREITMLATVGSLVGTLLGKALHAFVIVQIKVDGMYFPHQIFPRSYVFAVALTLVFTLLITWGMRPRLNAIDMAESLKSVE